MASAEAEEPGIGGELGLFLVLFLFLFFFEFGFEFGLKFGFEFGLKFGFPAPAGCLAEAEVVAPPRADEPLVGLPPWPNWFVGGLAPTFIEFPPM